MDLDKGDLDQERGLPSAHLHFLRPPTGAQVTEDAQAVGTGGHFLLRPESLRGRSALETGRAGRPGLEHDLPGLPIGVHRRIEESLEEDRFLQDDPVQNLGFEAAPDLHRADLGRGKARAGHLDRIAARRHVLHLEETTVVGPGIQEQSFQATHGGVVDRVACRLRAELYPARCGGNTFGSLHPTGDGGTGPQPQSAGRRHPSGLDRNPPEVDRHKGSGLETQVQISGRQPAAPTPFRNRAGHGRLGKAELSWWSRCRPQPHRNFCRNRLPRKELERAAEPSGRKEEEVRGHLPVLADGQRPVLTPEAVKFGVERPGRTRREVQGRRSRDFNNRAASGALGRSPVQPGFHACWSRPTCPERHLDGHRHGCGAPEGEPQQCESAPSHQAPSLFFE